MRNNENIKPKTYPAEKARQGEIILRQPWQRIVFVAGLIGLAVLAALAGGFGGW